MRRLLLLLLTACSVPQEDFEAEYPVEACDFATACYPYAFADTASCADLAGLDTGCGPYDGAQGQACLAALQALDCPEAGSELAWPEACEQVYGCTAPSGE